MACIANPSRKIVSPIGAPKLMRHGVVDLLDPGRLPAQMLAGSNYVRKSGPELLKIRTPTANPMGPVGPFAPMVRDPCATPCFSAWFGNLRQPLISAREPVSRAVHGQPEQPSVAGRFAGNPYGLREGGD